MPARKEPETHLGAAIRDGRIAKGWTSQHDLIEALAAVGYERSQDTISRWEVGTRVPDADELFALGVVLDRPVELREAHWRDGEAAFDNLRLLERGIPGYLCRLTSPTWNARPTGFRVARPAAVPMVV